MRPLSLSATLSAQLVDSGLEIVVTGASGWLGKATLEMMESCLGSSAASRVHAFASAERTMMLRSGTSVEVHSLRDLPEWDGAPHLLVHYAFATREHLLRLGIAEYVARNEEISALVVGHAARHRPIGMAVLSSGAVYLGDDLSTNPYGVLKARDERAFFDLAERQGGSVPTSRLLVPRLFNLSGPYLNKPVAYVLGSIIRDIGLGGPIRLEATHPVIRSYVYVGNLIELLFAGMLGDRPLPVQGFDTAGEREVEVGELARLAASVLGSPGIPIERPPLETTEEDRYVGDPSIMQSLVETYGVEMLGLPEQIEDTADFMREWG